MSLLTTLAGGARASSTPSGFAGASTRAGSVASVGGLVIASVAVFALTTAGAAVASGSPVASSAGAAVTAGPGLVTALGRQVAPVLGAAVNALVGAGSVLASGHAVLASAAQFAASGTGSVLASGHAVLPAVGALAQTITGGASAIGAPAVSGASVATATSTGAVIALGRAVSINAGGTVSVATSTGAAIAAGNPVTASAAILASTSAGSALAAGQPAAAFAATSAATITGSVNAFGRGVSASNGSSISVATATGAVAAAGTQALVGAGVSVITGTGSATANGRPVGASSTDLIEPHTADGLAILQLGMSDLNGAGGENPWANYRTLLNGIGGGEAAKIAADEWDPATGFLYVPPNTTYTIDRVRPLAAPPGNFDIDPGVWVLKATTLANSGAGGTAPTVNILAPGFVVNGSAGNVIRKTEDLTGQLNGDQVTLDGGVNGGRIRIDFWGPEIYEASPAQFHPNAKKYYGRYKVLRNLDLVDASGSKITLDSQWINDTDYIKHRSANSMAFAPPPANPERERAGYAYGEFFRLCVETDAAAYCCFPFALGAASVDLELRGYASGGPFNSTQLKDAVFANAATIFAAAEVEYYKHGQRIGASLAAQNYPPKRALFLEFGNEPWNGANFSFARTNHYLNALGRFLTGSDNYAQGLGAMGARAFKNLRKGITETRPTQEIVYILGMQTSAYFGSGGQNLDQVVIQLDAFTDPEAVPKIDIWAATTSYISGAHLWNKNKSPGLGNPWGATSEAAFDSSYIASHSTDPVAHRATVRDWFINPTSTNDSTSNMIVKNLGFRDRAHFHGLAGILQYEGGFSDTPIVGTLPTAYPTVKTAVLDFIRSVEGETVILDMIDRLRAINPTNPAKTSGWRPTELMISNYRDVGRRLSHDVAWVEREANQLNADLTGQMAGAWQARGRLQPAALPGGTSAGLVTAIGHPVTASAGTPVSVQTVTGSASAAGNPVTASAGGSLLLASWDLNAYASIEGLITDGWVFTGDWQLIDDGGSRALFGTTGVVTSPVFRAVASGNSAARLACSLKTGDVATSTDLLRFIDSSTGVTASIRLASDERASANRAGSAVSVLSATAPQPIGVYGGFGVGYLADGAAGFVRLLKDGADNGAFTGDTADAALGGLDRLAFVAHAGGVYVRNLIEVFSDPAGGVSGALAFAATATGAVQTTGELAIASVAGAGLLFSWSVEDFASIPEMEAAGFVFEPGHDWFVDLEGGERVLKGTHGHFSTPIFRAPASGAQTARLLTDIRFGNVLVEAQCLSFHDSSTDLGAAIRISPADKIRVRRFGGLTTVLTASLPQNIGGFNETEIALFVADANGVVTIKKNGVDNGSFTGDTLETPGAGIDQMRFYGVAEQTSLRRTIEIHSDGPASAIVAATSAAPVIATGNQVTVTIAALAATSTGAVTATGQQVSTPTIASTSAGSVTAIGHQVTAVIGAFEFAIFRLDYEAGIPLDFPLILSGAQVSGGSGDALFTGAQTNGGDLRAFMAGGTASPASLGKFDPVSGKMQIAMRALSALQYGDHIALRYGGSGVESFPAPGDALGEQAVFSGTGAVFFTHGDYVKNIVSGQTMVKDGSINGDGGNPLAIAAGLNGMLATGFGATDGSGSFDASDIATIQYPSAMKMAGLFDLNGQGGVAGPGLNRGRFFHGFQQGPEIYFNAGTMAAEIEYDVADGTQQRNFTWPLPSFAAPFTAQFSFDGSGSPSSLPVVKINGVAQSVTDTTVIDQTGKTALSTTGPMTFGNHWNGHDRNIDGVMSSMIVGDAAWNAALMDALESQYGDPVNFLKKVSSVAVIPSYVPTKIAESYNAALASPLSDANLQELDTLLIRPMVRDGNMALAYALNDFSSRGASDAVTKNILRANSTFDLTVFSGAPTFTPGASTAFDGVDDAYDTQALIGSGGLSRDNFSIILFDLSALGSALPAIGARGAASQTYVALNPRDATDILTGRMGVAANMTSSPTTFTTAGMRAVTARSSTDRAIYSGGSQIATDATASVANPSWSLIWGGLRTGTATASYSARTLGFGLLMRGLTTARMGQINGYLNNLMSARGII